MPTRNDCHEGWPVWAIAASVLTLALLLWLASEPAAEIVDRWWTDTSTAVAGTLVGPVLTAVHLYGAAAGFALAVLARALSRGPLLTEADACSPTTRAATAAETFRVAADRCNFTLLFAQYLIESAN